MRLLPNIRLASLLLVPGFFAARLLRNLTRRIMKRFSLHLGLNNLFSFTAYIFCLAVTFFMVLSILNLDKAVTSILAGAGILGLALAFAFQDIAANFISGIFIALSHPICVGHTVKVKDFIGKVEEFNMRVP